MSDDETVDGGEPKPTEAAPADEPSPFTEPEMEAFHGSENWERLHQNDDD